MLHVPKLRQRNDTSCLPTCVESVLQFLGYDIAPSEVAGWCHTTLSGCDVDLAVQGLRDAGFDASLSQCSVADLSELIDVGHPPIIILKEVEGWTHAVVVCDITDSKVVLMDPRTGGYQLLTHEELYIMWLPGHGEVMQVGKSSS
jgi:ABC-type bacteriocin/lantibiotic exporter with double-glycine peptidase domain